MNRYLTGLLAVIIAISAAAFTKPAKLPLVYFSYSGNTNNSGNVANESMWVEASQNANCNADDKACQIAVDEDFVSGSPGSRTLSGNTNVVINSAEGGVPGHYYPTYQSGSSITVLNKP